MDKIRAYNLKTDPNSKYKNNLEELYKADILYRFLKEETKIITDEQYESLINPIYNWYTQMKILHNNIKVAMIPIIYKDKLVLELTETNIDIMLPNSINNIMLSIAGNKYKIKVQNTDTLIIDENTYKNILNLTLSKTLIAPNKIKTQLCEYALADFNQLIHQLETLSGKRLNERQKQNENKALSNSWKALRLDDLPDLIEDEAIDVVEKIEFRTKYIILHKLIKSNVDLKPDNIAKLIELSYEVRTTLTQIITGTNQ